MIETILPLDTWIAASWEEYLRVCDDSAYTTAKFYYSKGQMRVEMTPLGNDHASDHAITTYILYLYAGIKKIAINGKDSCTYRKEKKQEIQPDLSFYIGDQVDAVPYGTKIINLDLYPAPDLVIEISDTTLADDKGEKRLLYEELGIKEYWIVDVKKVAILAFSIADGGSKRILESQVLPGLSISFVQEVLLKSRQMNHGQVATWLIQTLQGSNE